LALRAAQKEWVEFRDKVCRDLDGALTGPDGRWLALGAEYEKWEPEILGEGEMSAAQRKADVLAAVLRTYTGLWSRRAAGEEPVPEGLAALPPDRILACLQHHRDLIPTHLGPKMILDRLFLELREGLSRGELRDRSFTGSFAPI
jgi:hypothetical protein